MGKGKFVHSFLSFLLPLSSFFFFFEVPEVESVRKKLHGKDIYMYRGEKSFCSADCRYTQMVMDERKEKCSAEASAAAEVVGSPYANGQMFTAGILAA